MKMKRIPAAVFALLMVLSLAPQALVCGTVQKHECSCCGGGTSCTCCDIVPLYPEQSGAAASAPQVAAPEAWTPVAEGLVPPDGAAVPAAIAGSHLHGPSPLLKTTQLRI